MNKTETAQILATLKAAFPNAFKGMDAADREAMVILWQRMFANDTYEEVSKAVDNLIRTREFGWTPSVGEVTAELAKARKANIQNEEDAWKAVRKAARNGTYHAEEEFAKLSPVIQNILGGPSAIKEFAGYSDKDMDAASGWFKKTYKNELDHMAMENAIAPNSAELHYFADRVKIEQ